MVLVDLIKKKKKQEKKQDKGKLRLKFSLHCRGVIFNVLGRLSSDIVLNVNIFGACLEERACSSTNVELNGAKVDFRDVFYSVHSKIFKARCVVGVQQVSELFKCSELR